MFITTTRYLCTLAGLVQLVPPQDGLARKESNGVQSRAVRHRIFICYRAGDSDATTGRIRDHLALAYGADMVFKDASDIPLGVDVSKYMRELFESCSVILVVLGQRWLTTSDSEDPNGARTIDRTNDPIRMEIAAALQSSAVVIPIVVDGASLPPPSDLPPDIRTLVSRRELIIRHDPDFAGDTAVLIEQIRGHFADRGYITQRMRREDRMKAVQRGAWSALPRTKPAPRCTVASEPSPVDQPWQGPIPQFRKVVKHKLQALADRAPVLLIVVSEIERRAVLRLMRPANGELVKGHSGQQTYYYGLFGAHRAVLTTCEMGATGRDAANLSIMQAIDDVTPGCIVMVGVAFGRSPDTQHLGQVLVASHVVSYELQRIGASDVTYHGVKAEADGALKDRFKNLDEWEFALPSGALARYTIGAVLSGEKQVDDPAFKANLFTTFPEALGGEMEGAGLYAAASRAKLPWILVKGISSWADGHDDDTHQPLAAAAAASLVHAALSNPYALEGVLPSPVLPPTDYGRRS